MAGEIRASAARARFPVKRASIGVLAPFPAPGFLPDSRPCLHSKRGWVSAFVAEGTLSAKLVRFCDALPGYLMSFPHFLSPEIIGASLVIGSAVISGFFVSNVERAKQRYDAKIAEIDKQLSKAQEAIGRSYQFYDPALTRL
ncbi:MAG TPA: hypothetical protein VKB51_19755, partial [bacterium]|nr:hypothetical protein [bacterium]